MQLVMVLMMVKLTMMDVIDGEKDGKSEYNDLRTPWTYGQDCDLQKTVYVESSYVAQLLTPKRARDKIQSKDLFKADFPHPSPPT